MDNSIIEKPKYLEPIILAEMLQKKNSLLINHVMMQALIEF